MSYALRCVKRGGVTPEALAELKALARTSEQWRELSRGSRSAFSLDLSQAPELKSALMEVSRRHQIDVAVLPRSEIKLVVFDMDSTLIQAEVIDEMASRHRVGEQVQAITKRAMGGEMDFDQSLRERLSYLNGAPESMLNEIYHAIQLTDGVETFMRVAHERGIRTVILSGGFTFFAERFRSRLDMHAAHANQLEVVAGKLTGKVTGEILNAQKKVVLMEKFARELQLPLTQVMAVGDGANDLPMLAAAGVGVAFHGKEKVRQNARTLIDHGPMSTLLYYLGIEGEHF